MAFVSSQTSPTVLLTVDEANFPFILCCLSTLFYPQLKLNSNAITDKEFNKYSNTLVASLTR